MVKKILILGASGMLGGSLFRYLSEIKSLDILAQSVQKVLVKN